MDKETREDVEKWWNKIPVDERIHLKNIYTDKRHLVNLKTNDLIKIYNERQRTIIATNSK